MRELKGICCALCTPFEASGERVDEAALRRHVDSMLEAGVHIILVCGGTGEFAYLRGEERRRIAEIAARHIDGRAGFMVQTSAIATSEAVEFSKHAADLGADALLVLPPYFEGPDLDGVYDHFARLAAAVPTPLMVYNIPAHSGIDITPEFFSRLLEIDTLGSIKDSTGDLVRLQQLLLGGGTIFNGADPLAFHGLLAGCAGCVWGAVNAMPREAVELYDLVSAGRLHEARELWRRMLPSNLFFWSHVYNAAVKAAANLSGRPVGPCRAPVRPLGAAELTELRAALARLQGSAEEAAHPAA